MRKKLLPNQLKQLKLYKIIDEILWKDWDPINVNDIEDVRDEYQSYVPHIFRLALEGKNEKQIADSLETTIESEMGLTSSKEQNLAVATKIIQAKLKIIGA